MSKIFSLFAVVFLSFSLVFANSEQLDPRPPQQPPPSQPYPPHQPPHYGDVYGPGRTVRWQDMGIFKAIKVIETQVRLDTRGQFINEIYVKANSNSVEIKSALAYLVNGQVIEVRQLLGTVRKGQEFRVLLDYRNSLRLDRVELVIQSGLFGGSGKLNVQLGLAY
jgi:hypothetical protein